MTRRTWVGLIGVLLALSAPLADRLHLQGGGVLDVHRWWYEGDTLVYETGGGTVSVPRSLVVKIEPSTVAAPEPPKSAPEPAPSWPSLSQRRSAEANRRFDEAIAALNGRRFEDASEAFRDVLRDLPSANAARVGYAMSELGLGRDERALPVVLEGLRREPDHPELLELLGDLRDREERVEEALSAWESARQLRPSKRLDGKIERARRELDAGRDYAYTATPHFNLRYDGDLDRTLSEELGEHLERELRRVSDELRHSPKQPITVLVYPDRDFRDVTQTGPEVAGLFDGKIRVPLGGQRRLDPRSRQLLIHELTHAVLHAKTRGNAPRWLHEGLAQRMEGRTLGRADRQRVVRLLREGRPEAWDRGGFSYPAALSLTLYIEETYRFYGVLELLENLERGLALEAALKDAFGIGYERLCRDWSETVLAEEGR